MVSYKLNNVEGHDRLKANLQKAMKQTNCDVHGHECHQDCLREIFIWANDYR
jgi:hypothetical protein